MDRAEHNPLGRHFGVLAVLAVGYFVAAASCLFLFKGGESSVSVWLANVFSVGLLLRNPGISPFKAAVPIFLGALAANFAYGNRVDIGLLFSCVNVVGIVTGLLLVRWFKAWTPERHAVTAYVHTLVLAGFVAPAIAGLVLAAVAGTLYQWPFVPTLKGWFAGDAFAFAMLLPVMLFSTHEQLRALRRGDALLRLVGWIVGCAAIGAAAVVWSEFPFIIAIIPLAVAAGRNKPFELGLICAASGASLVATAELTNVPVIEYIAGRVDGYQLAVAVMMVFPTLGGLLIHQLSLERSHIAKSELRFRRVMEDSAIGVSIITMEGRVVEVNQAFADMLGYTPSEMEGMSFQAFTHPEDTAIDVDVARDVLSGRSQYRYEKRYLHRNGDAVWVRISGSVVYDTETGSPLHYISQVENIDARKKSEAALVEAESRWNFALASAGQGVWEVDLRVGREHYSATWGEILGYANDDFMAEPGFWLTLVHPDDRDRVAEADREHMAGLTPHFEAEFRMRHKDGRWIWILDRGKVLERDEAGNPLRAIGTHTNITRIKEAEQRIAVSAAQLADEKERLRVTLEAIGDAVICTSADGRITFMNPVAEKLTKTTAEKAVGNPLNQFYQPVDEDSGELLSLHGEGARDRVDHNSRAILVRHDGSRCSIREVVSPIVNDHNEFAGSVIVFQDTTDARALQRELAYQAAHDPLTGLANRSSFMKTMEKLLDEVRRDRSEHQLVYLDLDHFKVVNDTSGHAAGDQLLKRVTEMIKRTLRPGDTAARLGGDEFAIVLRACSQRSALMLAQRLVDRLHALEFTWHGKLHAVGASAGIAPIDGSAETDEIIARADAACYSAKASGRGRVEGAASERAA